MRPPETPRVSFWFDYSCPYAYLASTQVEALARRTGATLMYEPMLLGGVFRANGTPQNLALVLSPAKKRHNELDMARWAALWGVPLTTPAGHPQRTVEALRATLACGLDPRVVKAFFHAYWVLGVAPSDEGTCRRVVREAGYDVDLVMSQLGTQAVKDDLRARTERAIALGIFGAPTFVVKDELYWGQDRLAFVERALRARPRA